MTAPTDSGHSPDHHADSNAHLLPILVATVLLALLALVAGNFYLNPLIYNSPGLRTAASSLNSGMNYAISDPNINWRALRKEHIQMMTSTPDVILWGGSDWQEASADLIPGKTFYNAHAHSDYCEGMFAIAQILGESGRMPQTLILSMRPLVFQPLKNRPFEEWLEWAPEYIAMAEKLGIEHHSRLDMLRIGHWRALLSLREFARMIIQRYRATERPGPTAQYELESLDVIAADGALHWSIDSQARFTLSNARKSSEKMLRHLSGKRDAEAQVDSAMVAATDRLLAYLTEKGVRIVLARTPFHPVYYDGVQNSSLANTFEQVDAIARQFAEKYGVEIVGSYDPREVGCSEDQFIDFHHSRRECLQAVLKPAFPTRVE